MFCLKDNYTRFKICFQKLVYLFIYLFIYLFGLNPLPVQVKSAPSFGIFKTRVQKQLYG